MRASAGAGHVRADGVIALGLQQAQQFDLGGGLEIADLVQEEGATRRLGDQALPLPVGAGEGPAHMAKEGIGEEVVIQAGGVQADQLPGPATEAMDGLGDEFLAGAGLARDEDRLPGVGDRLGR
jgi:hypothetical protein